MARTRYIKPDFFKDEHLKNLPFDIRLFYIGLWGQADREGRLEDRPARLKIELMPYDKFDVEKALALLSKTKLDTSRPFIIRYSHNGDNYIQIVQWNKHQKPHHTEVESIIPGIDNGEVTVKDTLEKGGGQDGHLKSPSPLKSPLKSPLEKKQFLEFVRLTDEENQKLINAFGKTKTDMLIKNLNNYIGSKGKKYKSHYYTILSWERNDSETKPKNPYEDVK